MEWLRRILKRSMNVVRVPEDWKETCFVSIYKGKGDKKEFEDYGGFSLLSSPGKGIDGYGGVCIESNSRHKTKTKG